MISLKLITIGVSEPGPYLGASPGRAGVQNLVALRKFQSGIDDYQLATHQIIG